MKSNYLSEEINKENIQVTKSSLPPFDEYIKEIEDIFDNRWLTNMGPKHEKFEKELERYFGTKHVCLFTNGHLALENAFASFNFPKDSEIITTPFTFASTTHAIVRNNLVPVFCDINEDNYTIDVTKIEELITEKTVAICPVHVYGNICDVEEIDRIAKKHNLKVVYDAAHAFGVKCKRGVPITNFGDMSMFSFHATKVFNTIEGGCVCFNDDSKAVIMNDLKNFGIHGPESVQYIGGNAKMNEFQAAMGLCNLRHIDQWIAQRKQVVDCYKEKLSNIQGIKLCQPQEGVTSNYAYFPVVFDNYKYTRDEIYKKLKQERIFARKYFFPLVNDFECYKQYNSNKTPIAKYIANRILTLPLYPDLDLKIVDKISNIILEKI